MSTTISLPLNYTWGRGIKDHRRTKRTPGNVDLSEMWFYGGFRIRGVLVVRGHKGRGRFDICPSQRVVLPQMRGDGGRGVRGLLVVRHVEGGGRGPDLRGRSGLFGAASRGLHAYDGPRDVALLPLPR